MAIYQHPDGPGILIPTSVLFDPALTMRDRGVLLTLLDADPERDLSPHELRDLIPADGIYRIRRALDALQRRGYVAFNPDGTIHVLDKARHPQHIKEMA